jgi:hypothetical protein
MCFQIQLQPLQAGEFRLSWNAYIDAAMFALSLVGLYKVECS